MLIKSKAYAENSVVVEQAAVEFVSEGRSVFCKFVTRVGKHVLPSGEVAVLDPAGRVIAVGSAKVHGDFMRQFKPRRGRQDQRQRQRGAGRLSRSRVRATMTLRLDQPTADVRRSGWE